MAEPRKNFSRAVRPACLRDWCSKRYKWVPLVRHLSQTWEAVVNCRAKEICGRISPTRITAIVSVNQTYHNEIKVIVLIRPDVRDWAQRCKIGRLFWIRSFRCSPYRRPIMRRHTSNSLFSQDFSKVRSFGVLFIWEKIKQGGKLARHCFCAADFISDTARLTLTTCDSGCQPGVCNETHVI